jgi:magnesium-protoporphyrin IX monomethyl ester (oxidative) cyclase
VAYNILVGFPGEDESEYARIAREIPKLVHLRPPSGMPAIEFHRFSPYHQAPKSFGIRLRPSSIYRDLYPFSEEEIGRFAYLFEVADDPAPNLAYADDLFRQIHGWRRAYRENDCTLTWRPDGGDVIVHDRRHAAAGRLFRLQGFAAEAFHLSDAPRPLTSLLEAAAGPAPREDDACKFVRDLFAGWAAAGETVIRFTREQFLADPNDCLRPLVDSGIFYVEDKRCLALPITESYRPTTARWLETYV